MPVYSTHVDFPIHDEPTLQFMDHCFEHWRDATLCTDAHVLFMKHLVRSIFRLPPGMPLVGIRFEDDTLALLNPPGHTNVFYVLTRSALQTEGQWRAQRVRTEGFVPQWGLETGFWDGLRMAECVTMGAESAGPAEDGGSLVLSFEDD